MVKKTKYGVAGVLSSFGISSFVSFFSSYMTCKPSMVSRTPVLANQWCKGEALDNVDLHG